VRYGLLETVRVYAADRLAESGEADLAAAAHIDYFLDLAERAEPQLRTRDQLVWLNLLSAEHDNLSAALRNVVAAEDVGAALRFFRSLAWFWILRDYDAEAREWSTEVLRIAGDTPPDDLSEEYAMCQIVATMTKAMNDPSGDPQQALEVLSRLTLPEEPGHPLLAMAAPMLTFLGGDTEGAYKQLRDIPEHRDPWVTATRRSMTGHLALNDGDIGAAAADLADGLARFERLGDRFGLVGCLVGLAQVAIARNRPDEAVRALEQAREHAAALAGNMGGILGISLGEARARTGDTERARADLQDGVRAAELAGELDDAASGYLQLAEVARHADDLAGAGDLLQSALAIVASRLQRPDMFAMAAATFSKLGCIAEQEGDLAGAAAWQQRAIDTLSGSPASQDRSDQRLVAILPINRTLAAVVDAIAALAAARGEHARAAELLGLAHTLQGFSDAWSLEVARATAAARKALGDTDFEAACARGRNRDGAKAYALALRP
jgi:tetratricopeptide (TPR) repeat protein